MRCGATASGSSMGASDVTAVQDPGAEIERRRGEVPEMAGGHTSPDRRLTIHGASFSGPLPAPGILAEYDEVVPGLAREIVDQWKEETRHRHATVAGLRETDHEEMVKYYEAERRGQTFGILAIVGVLMVAIVAIALDRPVVGVAGLLTGGAAVIWAMRRRSAGPDGEAETRAGDRDVNGAGTAGW